SPGPTSTTTSSPSSPAALTIRRTVFGSCTKFCPSRFVGRRPSSAASERTSAGPSSRDCVVVTRAACRSAREAETPGARGPRPVPAAVVPHAGRDGDLLLAGGLVRQRRVVGAAVGAPGTGVELQAPVVAVAGVDRPVARGLALREP